MVQTIQINLEKLNLIQKLFKRAQQKLATFVGRVNHMYFPKMNDEMNFDADFSDVNNLKQLTFTFYIQLFSSIGCKIQFNIDLATNNVHLDDIAMNQIQLYLVNPNIISQNNEERIIDDSMLEQTTNDNKSTKLQERAMREGYNDHDKLFNDEPEEDCSETINKLVIFNDDLDNS